MVTKEDILKELNKLIGENADIHKINSIIRNFFSIQPGFEIGCVFSWKKGGQRLWFQWRYYTVLEVIYKRKKGDTHYRPWYSGGSYTDYTFKEFEVLLCGSETLEESIKKAEINYQKNMQEEKEENKKAIDIVKYAREKFKLDDTELRALFYTIDRKIYKFIQMVDEEDMTADEIAYNRYIHFEYSYQDYLDVCEQENVEPLPRVRPA